MNKFLKYEIKRRFIGKSDRVKSVDIHPTEPWILSALYSGQINIWNYSTQSLHKTLEVSGFPLRCGQFIPRKNWIICGSDDLQLRVYNYNTFEKVIEFAGHSDYIRCIAIHPTLSYVLSGGDDCVIKLWDWEKNWSCIKTFDGHGHFIMSICINPKDTMIFASGSLDKTIRVWNLGNGQLHYKLEGHEKGVCSVSYYPGAEKSYLLSGGDDKLVKCWDTTTKYCLQSLSGHGHNISAVLFHSNLPVALSASEDGTIKVWNSQHFKLEETLSLGLERIWSLATIKGENLIVIGGDKGTLLLQIGSEVPVLSMDGSGKIIWAKGNEIFSTNVKTSALEKDILDGERLTLPRKELGHCDVAPRRLKHCPNGRFVAVLGDGEYIIYTAIAWRNKVFGPGQDFAWSDDSNYYAVLESHNKVSIYKNFELSGTVNDQASNVQNLFSGPLLGKSIENKGLEFHDWSSGIFIRRIQVESSGIYWSESGEFLIVTSTRGGFFLLKYQRDAVQGYIEQELDIPEDGIQESFEVLNEFEEDVLSGLWIGDVFVFTTPNNKLNYCLGGQVHFVSHMMKNLYLVGTHSKMEKVYLSDKYCNLYAYTLNFAVLEYQLLILKGNLSSAQILLPNIPAGYRTQIAIFLEAQGYKELAMEITTDEEQKFSLAVELKAYEIALSIARKQNVKNKWNLLTMLAAKEWKLTTLLEALKECKASDDLLLLSFALKSDLIGGKGPSNVRFMNAVMTGDKKEAFHILCEAKRFTEAAFFAKTYRLSNNDIETALEGWKSSLQEKKKGKLDLSELLATPQNAPHLFKEATTEQDLLSEKILLMNISEQMLSLSDNEKESLLASPPRQQVPLSSKQTWELTKNSSDNVTTSRDNLTARKESLTDETLPPPPLQTYQQAPFFLEVEERSSSPPSATTTHHKASPPIGAGFHQHSYLDDMLSLNRNPASFFDPPGRAMGGTHSDTASHFSMEVNTTSTNSLKDDAEETQVPFNSSSWYSHQRALDLDDTTKGKAEVGTNRPSVKPSMATTMTMKDFMEEEEEGDSDDLGLLEDYHQTRPITDLGSFDFHKQLEKDIEPADFDKPKSIHTSPPPKSFSDAFVETSDEANENLDGWDAKDD